MPITVIYFIKSKSAWLSWWVITRYRLRKSLLFETMAWQVWTLVTLWGFSAVLSILRLMGISNNLQNQVKDAPTIQSKNSGTKAGVILLILISFRSSLLHTIYLPHSMQKFWSRRDAKRIWQLTGNISVTSHFTYRLLFSCCSTAAILGSQLELQFNKVRNKQVCQ